MRGQGGQGLWRWWNNEGENMKLTTEKGLSFKNVTEEQLKIAFDDSSFGFFIILAQEPQRFIQAAVTTRHNSQYMVEYRNGDVQNHFQSTGYFSKEDIRKMFLWYLADDGRWLTEFEWKKVEIKKPWWKIW